MTLVLALILQRRLLQYLMVLGTDFMWYLVSPLIGYKDFEISGFNEKVMIYIIKLDFDFIKHYLRNRSALAVNC